MDKSIIPPPHPRPVLPRSTLPIFIRRGGLADAADIGRVAARTYLHDDLDQFLAPARFQHYRHYERGYIQRATQRMLQPNLITFVACTTADPATPIGYAQFQRLGNDAGAQAVIHETSLHWRMCLWIFSWLYHIFCKISWILVGGNKADDLVAISKFIAGLSEEGDKHWAPYAERENRWHARSVVVSEEFQARGIGKMLMREVIRRAEKDNVVVGIESSVRGERMYRSVGFELLERIGGDHHFEKDLGGVMIWTPPAWKHKESVKM